MRITLAYIGEKPKSQPCRKLTEEYITRSKRYLEVIERGFATTKKFEEFLLKEGASGALHLLLCDPRGALLSSEELAQRFEKLADSGTRHLLLAIGPADGWSDEQRAQANGVISFGRITLPHELCLVVLAEQTYRALTIRAGHPYHGGH